jgi:flagellar hook-associated protein 1 FlgK
MSSTFGGLNTVTMGLAAQQICLDTVGNNISNANTTGYSRQIANLATTPSQTVYAGNGPVSVGTGVTVATITRASNAFANQQYWQQNGASGYWQNQSTVLGNVENVFPDTQTTGLQATMNQFWSSLNTLSTNASDSPTRVSVVQNAETVVQDLQQDGTTLQGMANDLTDQVATQVTNINSLSTQIAALNAQITTQQTSGLQPNDLLDQRDNLVDQLSALGTVNVSNGANGYTISMEGTTLVDGQNSYSLAVQSSYDSRYGYNTNQVVTTDVPPRVINFTGGQVGSLIQSRDQVVQGALQGLDSISQYLMQDFNAQQRSGTDANGNAGQNFFGVGTLDYTQAANDPTTGTPPASWLSQLQVNPALSASGGQQLIAASDGATGSGTADGNNALALANLINSAPSSPANPPNALNNSSLPDYYSNMISALGVQSQQAQNLDTNQTTLLNSADTWRQSVSGVNIDEEMSNMIKYQTAYGAAAKVINTIDNMLETLISEKAAS